MRDAVVVGGGQSGLAVAYYLRKCGSDFVVLDAADRPGGAWPHYWDALTLFSRAEFSNLPGWPMPPFDGYPPRDHVIDYLTRYEQRYDLPIRRGVRVSHMRYDGSAFHLNGLSARNVVVATGIWSAPFVPFIPGSIPGRQLHSAFYHRPGDFAGQRVAVVGGEQLFRRNRERFVAIARGDGDPGGADFGGEIVVVPEVHRARAAGLLTASPMVTSLDELAGFDALIWATGFRPALAPVRGLPLDTPGLYVLGFDRLNGPGAGTIGGVSPFARDIAARVAGSL